MRAFCISDIHGNYAALQSLLKRVKFKPTEDVLYVLGDMIDWGNSNVKVLQYLMKLQKKHPSNVFVSLGNHELLMLSALTGVNASLAMQCWFNNSGTITCNEFSSLTGKQKVEIIDWLKNLPYYFETPYYYLTHSNIIMPDAYPGAMSITTERMHEGLPMNAVFGVWDRVVPTSVKNKTNKVLISGHTIAYKYGTSKSPVTAYFALEDNYINIDCGAKQIGYRADYTGRLALLELPEKMEDVYDEKAYNVYYSKVQ